MDGENEVAGGQEIVHDVVGETEKVAGVRDVDCDEEGYGHDGKIAAT